jgi:hypothetical protein
MASHRIDNLTRQKLERLFDMSGGYVLDFSNASFSSFVESCLGFDPYSRYSGSKAAVLRRIWLAESPDDVAKLNRELLEHWHLEKLADDEVLTSFEQQTYDDLTSAFGEKIETESPASLDFLAKDLGEIDLSALPRELTSQRVIAVRLAEIEQCLAAEAPLAVIFLAGSTLEGLLMELALAHADEYASSQAAPQVGGKPKPLNTWTLAELITVSRALGVIGEDVLKHADQVRNFRNYIHPRQQLRENFEPRMITAQIAQQVLLAALADLENLSDAPTSS